MYIWLKVTGTFRRAQSSCIPRLFILINPLLKVIYQPLEPFRHALWDVSEFASINGGKEGGTRRNCGVPSAEMS